MRVCVAINVIVGVCFIWSSSTSLATPITGSVNQSQDIFAEIGHDNSTTTISHLPACPDLCVLLPKPLSQSEGYTAFSDSVPPADFAVDSYYLPSGRGDPFRKLDVYIATISALVVAAHSDFDDDARPTTFGEMPRVTIRIGGRGMKVKHVMWGLYIVAKWMEDQGRFEEAKFKILIGETLLGVGEYYRKRFVGEEGAASNGSAVLTPKTQTMANETEAEVGAGMVSGNAGNSSGVELGPAATQTNHTGHLITTARPPQLAIDLTYIPNSNFQSADVLQAIMKMIIDTAQYDITDPNRGLVYYTPQGDFFIIVRATSEANVGKLKCYIVIYSLQTMAGEMADDRRWSEFYGRIRWNGEIVGLISLHGGKPPMTPADELVGGFVEAY